MSTENHFPSKEFEIIASLEEICGPINRSRYSLGIGDDCAISLPSAQEQLISADTAVENVHFSLEYMTLEQIGYRAMVSNISDIAAMGGEPHSTVLQVVFPKDRAGKRELEELYNGITAATKKWNIDVVGGDLAQGRDWVIGITIMGSVLIRPLLRSSAKPGDALWVSGCPGLSSLGLEALQESYDTESYRQPVTSHIKPTPQIELGLALAQTPQVHACIDISDGIAKEALTIAQASSVGISIEMPHYLQSQFSEYSRTKKSPLDYFLYGGEDYELLFSADASYIPPKEWGCTKIGSVTANINAINFIENDSVTPLIKGGWDHFLD